MQQSYFSIDVLLLLLFEVQEIRKLGTSRKQVKLEINVFNLKRNLLIYV